MHLSLFLIFMNILQKFLDFRKQVAGQYSGKIILKKE